MGARFRALESATRLSGARPVSQEGASMLGSRWIVGIGAVLLAVAALYVLLRVGHESRPDAMTELSEPTLDEIDADSRRQMRELLRRDERQE